MSFWSFLTGGATDAIADVAKEWIQTDKESAEAKAVMVKAIDPNGKMRRDLSKFASTAYGFYLIATTILVFMHAYGIGDPVASKESMEAMTALFLPITTAWTAMVTASFGVNAANTIKQK